MRPTVDPGEWARRMGEAKERARRLKEERLGLSAAAAAEPAGVGAAGSAPPPRPAAAAELESQPSASSRYRGSGDRADQAGQHQHHFTNGRPPAADLGGAPPAGRAPYRGMVTYEGGGEERPPSQPLRVASRGMEGGQQAQSGSSRPSVGGYGAPRQTQEQEGSRHNGTADAAEDSFATMLRGGGDSGHAGHPGGRQPRPLRRRPEWNADVTLQSRDYDMDGEGAEPPAHPGAAPHAPEPSSGHPEPETHAQRLARMKSELRGGEEPHFPAAAAAAATLGRQQHRQASARLGAASPYAAAPDRPLSPPRPLSGAPRAGTPAANTSLSYSAASLEAPPSPPVRGAASARGGYNFEDMVSSVLQQGESGMEGSSSSSRTGSVGARPSLLPLPSRAAHTPSGTGNDPRLGAAAAAPMPGTSRSGQPPQQQQLPPLSPPGSSGPFTSRSTDPGGSAAYASSPAPNPQQRQQLSLLKSKMQLKRASSAAFGPASALLFAAAASAEGEQEEGLPARRPLAVSGSSRSLPVIVSRGAGPQGHGSEWGEPERGKQHPAAHSAASSRHSSVDMGAMLGAGSDRGRRLTAAPTGEPGQPQQPLPQQPLPSFARKTVGGAADSGSGGPGVGAAPRGRGYAALASTAEEEDDDRGAAAPSFPSQYGGGRTASGATGQPRVVGGAARGPTAREQSAFRSAPVGGSGGRPGAGAGYDEHGYNEEEGEAGGGRHPIYQAVSAAAPSAARTPAYPPAPDSGLPDEQAPGEQQLEECGGCGRRFNPSVLEKHQRVCAKVFQTKRAAFKQEVVSEETKAAGGVPAAPTGGPGKKVKPGAAPRAGAPPAAAKAVATAAGAPSSNAWAAKSAALRAAMRSAREYTEAVAAGKSGSDLPPPPAPSAPDPGLIPCPNCGRRFSDKAAERHIPKCASILARPKALAKGSGSVAGASAATVRAGATGGVGSMGAGGPAAGAEQHHAALGRLSLGGHGARGGAREPAPQAPPSSRQQQPVQREAERVAPRRPPPAMPPLQQQQQRSDAPGRLSSGGALGDPFADSVPPQAALSGSGRYSVGGPGAVSSRRQQY